MTRTITSALNTPHPRYEAIGDALLYLTKLENRPLRLTEIAYAWCALIWETRHSCKDWELLLFLSLEVGFRSFDPLKTWCFINLTHTEHHQELADAVFKSHRSEAIADLFCALTMHDDDEPAVKSFGICKQYIVDLRDTVTVPFSPRLQRLVMHSIALIGCKGFEEVGTERFVGLLNHLPISIEDTDVAPIGSSILLETAQSPEGHRYLAIQSWELLVRLATSHPWTMSGATYTPHVTSSLLEAEEWEKLECWMGIVWMMGPPEIDDVPEELEHAMVSLFLQRPGALPKLAQWMEQWSKECGADVPETFERMCEQGREVVL